MLARDSNDVISKELYIRDTVPSNTFEGLNICLMLAQ